MLIRSDLSIKKSSIHGVGIFADRDFIAGEEILRLFGNPKEIIYLNHSCSPNSLVLQPVEEDMQTHILISKGIKRGEEIVNDYRIGKLYIDYWKKTMIPCFCPKCKLVI